jgi:hypothetical protein
MSANGYQSGRTRERVLNQGSFSAECRAQGSRLQKKQWSPNSKKRETVARLPRSRKDRHCELTLVRFAMRSSCRWGGTLSGPRRSRTPPRDQMPYPTMGQSGRRAKGTRVPLIHEHKDLCWGRLPSLLENAMVFSCPTRRTLDQHHAGSSLYEQQPGTLGIPASLSRCPFA